mgnify:CR=1 FL=1
MAGKRAYAKGECALDFNKKILIWIGMFAIWLTFSGCSGPAVPASAPSVPISQPVTDQVPPEIYILNDKWPEDHENPLGRGNKMKSKSIKSLYADKNDKSRVVTMLKPDEYALLITSDYHAFPSKSRVIVTAEVFADRHELERSLRPGEAVYLMGDIGEGLYMAWYHGKVISVPASGIVGLKDVRRETDERIWAKLEGSPPKSELWLRLKAANGVEGWCLYNYDDWQRNKHSIFF